MFRKLWARFQTARLLHSYPKGERLLRAPIDTPMILDRLWDEFGKTGNVAAVRRIVSVLDWDDLVRSRLQAWLAEICPEMWVQSRYKEHRELFVRCQFPINYEERSIEGPIDLDIHVALLARAAKLKFRELPISLSPKELVRLGMKSAAIWSLTLMAKQHQAVAIVCDEESRKPGGAARLHLANLQRYHTREE